MKIVNIRRLTDEEMADEGWFVDNIYPNPVALELDTGDVIFPSCDPEGNGPGALFGRKPNGEGFFWSP